MKLLCHRGYWNESSEQNSLQALEAAAKDGLGVETDLRDCDGQLVISHDPPRCDSILRFNEYLESYVRNSRRGFLALNIKSDGLHEMLERAIKSYEVSNYFVFDMSIPDSIGYLKRRIPIAIRLSEYESSPELIERTDFVWLDAFERDWYSADLLLSLLRSGKRVCVVSPELHKRPHRDLWSILSTIPPSLSNQILLCTDLWSEALRIFNVDED